jgi:hypothetical protein
MTTRRQFIIGATAGAAALTLPSRAFAGPPVEGTFGFVTDIHHGGGAAFRLGIWERDALSLRFPYFTGGDIVERADSTSNWSSAKAWRDRVRTSTGIRDTLLGPEGNHDEKDGSALYAANWCEPDGSRTMSGPVLYRVVWVSPSSVPLADGHSRCLYDGKLAWLDRTLAQSSLRTFVILHAPLEKTIPKDPQGTWTENPVMVATPTEGLDAIFARHRHVAAILSGHVHPGRNQRWYGWREVAPGPAPGHHLEDDMTPLPGVTSGGVMGELHAVTGPPGPLRGPDRDVLLLAMEKLDGLRATLARTREMLDASLEATARAQERAREAERERDELIRRHQNARAYLAELTDTPLKASVMRILQGTAP